jgi:hypothetical protein
MGRYSNRGEMASELQILLDMTPEPGPVIERKEKQFHHRLYSEEIEQLIADYQAGAKVRDLADRYRVNRNTVIQHINRAGVRRHYPALNPGEVEEAAQLYQSGQSLVSVSERFVVNATTIRSALLKAGVAMRDCHGRKH